MASQRKRGPVAFRPRLSAGLAFSSLKLHGQSCRFCVIRGFVDVPFGSVAAPQDSTIPAAAIERIPVVR